MPRIVEIGQETRPGLILRRVVDVDSLERQEGLRVGGGGPHILETREGPPVPAFAVEDRRLFTHPLVDGEGVGLELVGKGVVLVLARHGNSRGLLDLKRFKDDREGSPLSRCVGDVEASRLGKNQQGENQQGTRRSGAARARGDRAEGGKRRTGEQVSRIGLADVASRAGVSLATASLVLRRRPGPSEETSRRVRDAASELGYRVDLAASRLAGKRSHALGLVLDVTHPFHAELTMLLDAAADDRGLQLVLSPMGRRGEDEAVESLLDHRCDGVILLGSALSAKRLRTLDERSPVVVLGRAVAGVDSVLADDAAGLRMAVDHLVDTGRRSLAFADGPAGPIARARRDGFRAAAAEAGVAAEVIPAGDDEASGLAAANRLAANGIDAAIGYNDRVAAGLREGLVRRGKAVPKDVALVGIDDSPLARMSTIDLTSVSQSPEVMAEHCLRRLVSRLEDPMIEAGEHTVIEPRLAVRTSSGGPPKSPPPQRDRPI